MKRRDFLKGLAVTPSIVIGMPETSTPKLDKLKPLNDAKISTLRVEINGVDKWIRVYDDHS